MRRLKIGWIICGVITLAFGARDMYRVATVPAYSTRLPRSIPPENAKGFRNAYPFTYRVEMTDITVGDRQDNERWYTDNSGYFAMHEHNGRLREVKYGKPIDTYSLELDTSFQENNPFPLRATHCFGFRLSGIRDMPIGIQFADDAAVGAKARPVSNVVYSVLSHGPGVQSPDASWDKGIFYLIGRYNIPKTVRYPTISFGIAPRNHAILYAENPMPGWWGRSTGADLALHRGSPKGSSIGSESLWQKELVSVRTPFLPTSGSSRLPPFAFAVYAVTLDGKEHVMRILDGSHGIGREIGYICDDVPRENICSVRVLIAPYFWTRYRNVPLRPPR